MDFTSQHRIWNPEKQRLSITVVGAGSTGSFIALTLAKMGFNNLKVIDYDEVETHNIPNQFYRIDDTDKLKVEALKEIVGEFTGTEIQIENNKIDENYFFDLNMNSVVIICVDNMEARKVIFELLKDSPVKILDTRMGGEGFSLHVVDLDNEEEKEKYAKSLDAEIKDTVCGEKGIIYTILSIASETCNIVKMIDRDEDYPKIVRREMKAYRFIAK